MCRFGVLAGEVVSLQLSAARAVPLDREANLFEASDAVVSIGPGGGNDTGIGGGVKE